MYVEYCLGEGKSRRLQHINSVYRDPPLSNVNALYTPFHTERKPYRRSLVSEKAPSPQEVEEWFKGAGISLDALMTDDLRGEVKRTFYTQGTTGTWRQYLC